MSGKYRIMALDGGPAGPTYLRMLRHLVEDNPSLLAGVDMFAGTSHGAVLAAFFALHRPEERGVALVDKAIELSGAFLEAMTPTPSERLSFLTTTTSLQRGTAVRKKLVEYLGERTRLCDLDADALFVSFRVRPPPPNSTRCDRPCGTDCLGAGPRRSNPDPYQSTLRPKIYNNHVYERYRPDTGMPVLDDKGLSVRDPDEDRCENLVDVVLRSGAFPTIQPVWQGFIDGGIFANNPSMVALAQVLPGTVAYADADDGSRRRLPRVHSMDDIVLLSLGGNITSVDGVDPPQGSFVRRLASGSVLPLRVLRRLARIGHPPPPGYEEDVDLHSWGLLRWLGLPTAPGLLFELMVNGGDQGVDYQVSKLIGNRSRRLSLPSISTVMGLASLVTGRGDSLLRKAEETADSWAAGELELGPDPKSQSMTRESVDEWLATVWA